MKASKWQDTVLTAEMRFGNDYLLRQAAEEMSECAAALLKLIRAERNETPVPYEQARAEALEEIADVCVMLDALDVIMDPDARAVVEETQIDKMRRFRARMKGDANGPD